MGSLYIVSTPIGNRKDISLRALEVLGSVDFILAEDTRKTNNLLHSYQQLEDKKFQYLPFYEENEQKQAGKALQLLKKGRSLAIVSNAGTPLISDPGYQLVKVSLREGINVVPVPGASALLAALVGAGLPPNRFIFLGFLPKSKNKKKKMFVSLEEKQLSELGRFSVIFYESPHRLPGTLQAMKSVFGDLEIVLARELTKKFEEFRKGKISRLLADLKNKGEYVVLFELD